MNEVNHKARTHHEFGPSRMPYIEECAGFQGAEVSDYVKAAAEEGTASHEVMDKVARRVRELSAAHLHKFIDVLPFIISDETRLIEESERKLLEFCCREIDKFLAKAPVKLIENEIRVFINRPDGTELNHGSLDLLLLFGGDSAVLFDYKFGWKLVPHAKSNPQGLNYGLGVLNRHQHVNRLGIVFIQPKLNRVTSRMLLRSEYAQVYSRIESAIQRASEAAKLDPRSKEFAAVARPGAHCAYCALKGKCAAQLNQLALSVAEYSRQPISIDWSQLQTPETMAKARYLVDVLENMIDEIKKNATAMAKENGGTIGAVLPDGSEVTYEVAHRSVARSLGETGLIADLLGREYDITAEEILAAADLSLTKLMPMGVAVLQTRINGAVEKELKEAEAHLAKQVAEGKISKTDAKNHLAAAKRELKERMITKKEAEERFCSSLSAEGLLSRPDTTIEYLKLKKTPSTKQLNNT